MPRRTRAELEVENANLRDRLSNVYDQLVDYFEDGGEDGDDEGDDEQLDDEEEE